MAEYLLRAEGVNLGNVIDDTDDLSTRRGGGLMVLDAVQKLAGRIESLIGCPVKAIATGASVGLFTFEALDDSRADMVREVVSRYFQENQLLEHGTFVVDVVPVGVSAAEAEGRATAANRWRQMREPTVSLKSVFGEREPAGGPCVLDCVRPGVVKPKIPIPEQPDARVSFSVDARRTYGHSARQKFYERVLGERLGREFTNTFAMISDRRVETPEPAPSRGEERTPVLPAELAPANTGNKLAVLYLDGNGFGAIGRAAMGTGGFKDYTDWSDRLQEHHAGRLRELLDRTDDDASWRNGNRVRLETLLWGGDELLWIVPAWKGWELVELFFAGRHAVNDRLVTYAAGLVFCNTKAPIKNVVNLAHRLADDAKAAAKKVSDSAPPHRLAYEVLESFDDIHGDVDEHRRKWLPTGTHPEAMFFDPAQRPEFWDAVRAVAGCPDFPRRQLYSACKAWKADRDIGPHLKRLAASGAGADVARVAAAFGESKVAYLHLLQMLPYTPARGHTA